MLTSTLKLMKNYRHPPQRKTCECICEICWGEEVCGVRGQWGVFSQSTVYMYAIVKEYIF